MKKWALLQILAVLLVLIYGQICKANFKDMGISMLQTVEDTYNLKNCGLEFCFGDNPNTGDKEEDLYTNLCMYENDYITDSENASIVAIGEPTGNIRNYSQSFAQEVKITEVLKGTAIEINSNYFIYSNENFTLNENGQIMYTGLKNIMKKQNQYLLFLEPSELNGITDKDFYYLKGGFFSYLNISKNSELLMPNPIDMTQYNQLKNAEFFCTSKRILDKLNFIKGKIIENYIVA